MLHQILTCFGEVNAFENPKESYLVGHTNAGQVDKILGLTTIGQYDAQTIKLRSIGGFKQTIHAYNKLPITDWRVLADGEGMGIFYDLADLPGAGRTGPCSGHPIALRVDIGAVWLHELYKYAIVSLQLHFCPPIQGKLKRITLCKP